MIQIDFREPQEIQTYLSQFDICFQIKQLPIGDYVVNDWFIERKTWSDFFASYSSGRLYKQLLQLAQQRRSILLIEDAHLEHIEKLEFFYTILSTILTLYNVRIMFTKDKKHSAAFLSSLVKMKANTEKIYPIVQIKPTLSLQQQKERILLCFPNIGRVKAKKILQEFGNLKCFFLASAPELKKAGIGRKTRKNISNLLN